MNEQENGLNRSLRDLESLAQKVCFPFVSGL